MYSSSSYLASKKTGGAAPSAEEEKEAQTPPSLISITLGIQTVSSLAIAPNTQIATLAGMSPHTHIHTHAVLDFSYLT